MLEKEDGCHSSEGLGGGHSEGHEGWGVKELTL